jgi:hypothetical protein
MKEDQPQDGSGLPDELLNFMKEYPISAILPCKEKLYELYQRTLDIQDGIILYALEVLKETTNVIALERERIHGLINSIEPETNLTPELIEIFQNSPEKMQLFIDDAIKFHLSTLLDKINNPTSEDIKEFLDHIDIDTE